MIVWRAMSRLGISIEIASRVRKRVERASRAGTPWPCFGKKIRLAFGGNAESLPSTLLRPSAEDLSQSDLPLFPCALARGSQVR